MSKHIMLDLETMGNKPNAPITAIGAVLYDEKTKDVVRLCNYVVSLKSSVEYGLNMDADTVLWWMEQSDEARSIYTKKQKGASNLREALGPFSNLLKPLGDVQVWGNGVGFDNVILRNAYDKCGLECPFPFYMDRCYRTLKNLYPRIKMPERVGVYHNALDDAHTQMLHLIDILKEVEA